MRTLAADQIRLAVVRTGGFGGLSRSGTVDSRQLSAGEVSELADLLDAVDLDALAGSGPQSTAAGVPDAFHYEISVSRGGRRWDLVLSDPDVPDELRAVIRRVLRPTGTTRRAGHDRPSTS